MARKLSHVDSYLITQIELFHFIFIKHDWILQLSTSMYQDLKVPWGTYMKLNMHSLLLFPNSGYLRILEVDKNLQAASHTFQFLHSPLDITYCFISIDQLQYTRMCYYTTEQLSMLNLCLLRDQPKLPSLKSQRYLFLRQVCAARESCPYHPFAKWTSTEESSPS